MNPFACWWGIFPVTPVFVVLQCLVLSYSNVEVVAALYQVVLFAFQFMLTLVLLLSYRPQNEILPMCIFSLHPLPQPQGSRRVITQIIYQMSDISDVTEPIFCVCVSKHGSMNYMRSPQGQEKCCTSQMITYIATSSVF